MLAAFLPFFPVFSLRFFCRASGIFTFLFPPAQVSIVEHDGEGLFAGMQEPFQACRYHSLVVSGEDLPESLQKTAWLADGTVMGLKHTHYPIVGIQFHPESVLTNDGFRILAQFLKLAGIEVEVEIPLVSEECVGGESRSFETPDRPVTF